MKDTFRLCRKCGRPIDIIKERIYRKIIVDAFPVMVLPDPHGNEYIRLDGSKMRGTPAPMDIEHSQEAAEGVFRPHRCNDEM